ncbi:hypothetical protein ABKV19_014364 [Rosa sericea]
MTTVRSSLPSKIRQLQFAEGARGPSIKLDSTPDYYIDADYQVGDGFSFSGVVEWEENIDPDNMTYELWILGGSFGEDLNNIEAGWQVSPDLYGDSNTTVFIDLKVVITKDCKATQISSSDTRRWFI